MSPDFVTKLRKKIGTDRLQLVSVSGVAFNNKNETLLQLRSDSKTWATVSGVLEPDEQPAECLEREFLEETGAKVEVIGLASLYVEPEQRYRNGDRVQFLNLTFLVKLLNDPSVTDSESIDIRWVPLTDLPSLSTNNRRRIADGIKLNSQRS
jgi:ADP-ribose pyrophosphatase YjhB (NUDIX family)